MKEAAPPTPLRNVTSDEILQILGQKNFAPPDSKIDKETWDAMLGEVRKVVRELDLNLVLGSDPRVRMREDVCKPIDAKIQERNRNQELALLGDQTVSIIRREIGNRLSIRMTLGTHPDFQKLIAYVKRKNGELKRGEMRDEVSITIVGRMHACVKQFGDTPERRRIGYDYIADFLSEQAGIPVHFENLELRKKRTINRPSAKEGSDGTMRKGKKEEPGPLGDLEDTARELMGIKDELRQALGDFLLLLGTKAANIGTEIETFGREKASLVAELGPLHQELQPVEDAKREIDKAADALRRALVVTMTRKNPKIDTKTIQIPENQRKAFERQKKALEASAQDQYEKKARLERDIEILERKIQALTALKGLLPAHQLRLAQVLEILARLEMLPGRAAATTTTSAAPTEGSAVNAAPAATAAARTTAAPSAPSGLADNIDRDEDEPEIPERITTLAELEILSRRGSGLKLQTIATRDNHGTLSSAHVKKGGLTIGTVVQFKLVRVRSELGLKSLLNDDANIIPLKTDTAVARLGLSVIRQTPSWPSARTAARSKG